MKNLKQYYWIGGIVGVLLLLYLLGKSKSQAQAAVLPSAGYSFNPGIDTSGVTASLPMNLPTVSPLNATLDLGGILTPQQQLTALASSLNVLPNQPEAVQAFFAANPSYANNNTQLGQNETAAQMTYLGTGLGGSVL